MRVLAMVLAIWPMAGLAEEWRALDGAGIKAALEGRSLDYGDATQSFAAGGATVYLAGDSSTGQWRVDGNQYCSMWPPSDRWSCYDIDAKDGALRFVAADGSVTQGIYMP